MEQYKLSAEEITTVITLYSRIPTSEKRIYARGYLKCLGDLPYIEEVQSGGKYSKKQSEKAG